MSFLQWLNSTEAGLVFYFPLGLLLCIAVISALIALWRKRHSLLTVPAICIILATLLVGFLFSGYKTSVKGHFDTIGFISEKVFDKEPERSTIILYRMALMIRMFYFQVDFPEATEAQLIKGKEWQECGGGSNGVECFEYGSKQRQLNESETPCTINGDKAYEVSQGQIGFTEEQYQKNDYSDIFIVRNPEKTTYCLYWAR
ncbi:hypothetical protein [Deinococcus actinosclerus]|uniref:hypothetical protein n=1 Tax=Deinococcus actinosclerus TaxID=1768108 RepID=UPI0012FACAC6|nr:hypothetical protein [Deinococcus actinosclerus]